MVAVKQNVVDVLCDIAVIKLLSMRRLSISFRQL